MDASKMKGGKLASRKVQGQMPADKMNLELRSTRDAIGKLLTHSDAQEAAARYEVGLRVTQEGA